MVKHQKVLEYYENDRRFTEVIDKPTRAVNSSMSRIDVILCTNLNTTSKHGVDVSIFEKCHHGIIYDNINITVLLPSIYFCEV